MLLGNFSKKVLENRKPRPHDIINPKPTPIHKPVQNSTNGSVKSTPLNNDIAEYVEAYRANPVKNYTMQLKTGETNMA
jgi:hypothetical protein